MKGRPFSDRWVYLDTNVIISLSEALSGTWRPPVVIDRSDRQRLAAARIVLYGYCDRWPHWYLATSSEARAELRRGEQLHWLDVMFTEIDHHPDAPGNGDVVAEASRYNVGRCGRR